MLEKRKNSPSPTAETIWTKASEAATSVKIWQKDLQTTNSWAVRFVHHKELTHDQSTTSVQKLPWDNLQKINCMPVPCNWSVWQTWSPLRMNKYGRWNPHYFLIHMLHWFITFLTLGRFLHRFFKIVTSPNWPILANLSDMQIWFKLCASDSTITQDT